MKSKVVLCLYVCSKAKSYIKLLQVTATLSLAAASASAGITTLYFYDLGHCSVDNECQKYQASVGLAICCCFTIATSSLIMLWLLASG